MLRAMRARAAITIAIPSTVAGGLLLLATAGPASGEGPRRAVAPRAEAGAERYDPENVTGISQSMETLVKGNERYLAKDYPAAIDLYRKAIQLNPRSPLGPYLLGEGHLAAGNLGEAEASFKTAEELSDAKNPALRSRVLFVVADVYERQKKLPQAKAAWQTYAEHAARFADAGTFAHPASGAARLEAVSAMLQLEAQYVDVRARIAAEKEAAADAGAATKPPATPPKPAPKK